MLTWMLALAANGADNVVVDVVPGRVNHGTVSGVVDVPLSQVLGLILDCEGTSAWFPNLYDTRLIAADEDGYRCAGSTDLPWPLADRTWTIDVDRAERADGTTVVRFAYLPGSGNLTEMSGDYVLRAVGDRTAVDYHAAIDLGFWVPQPILDWATRQVLPGILDGLESAAPRLVAVNR